MYKIIDNRNSGHDHNNGHNNCESENEEQLLSENLGIRLPRFLRLLFYDMVLY